MPGSPDRTVKSPASAIEQHRGGGDQPPVWGVPAFIKSSQSVRSRDHGLAGILRRRSQTTETSSPIVSVIVLPQNRPPGRSIVLDHRESASSGRARRKATTL